MPYCASSRIKVAGLFVEVECRRGRGRGRAAGRGGRRRRLAARAIDVVHAHRGRSGRRIDAEARRVALDLLDLGLGLGIVVGRAAQPAVIRELVVLVQLVDIIELARTVGRVAQEGRRGRRHRRRVGREQAVQRGRGLGGSALQTVAPDLDRADAFVLRSHHLSSRVSQRRACQLTAGTPISPPAVCWLLAASSVHASCTFAPARVGMRPNWRKTEPVARERRRLETSGKRLV